MFSSLKFNYGVLILVIIDFVYIDHYIKDLYLG